MDEKRAELEKLEGQYQLALKEAASSVKAKGEMQA